MAGQPKITHRVAGKEDLPLLVRFREECGWGIPALMKGIDDPDRIYCVFIAEIEGEKKEVGMGCWVLHQPDDLELACRDTGVIHIASLFISKLYQGRRIGTAAMDLLERVAVLDLGAKSVTLDTTAYECNFSKYDGDGKIYVEEDFGKEGKNVGWYKARGYRQFRENRKLFPYPKPDDPDRLLTAAFLSKSAESIRSGLEVTMV